MVNVFVRPRMSIPVAAAGSACGELVDSRLRAAVTAGQLPVFRLAFSA